MDHDNPFATGAGAGQDLHNVGDVMQPVAMDPMAILERCWDILKKNPGTVIGTFLISAIPNCTTNVVNQGIQAGMEGADNDTASLLLLAVMAVSLVGGLLGLFFQLGAVRVNTRLARGIDAEVSMMFGEAAHYLPAVAMVIVMGVAVMTGMLLLIIPGIVLSIGLQFSLYAMVDQGLGPIEAMKESWRLTDGHKITVVGVNIAIGLLTLLFGCVTLGLGMVILAPLVSLTQAVMYHSLMHLQGPRPRIV